MNDYGHIVAKYWVKSPDPHPETGEEQWVRCTYTDRRITQEQAQELQRHYDLEAKDDGVSLHSQEDR